MLVGYFSSFIGGFDQPGSQSFTTTGATNFVVPNFENELIITLYGAGGGGQGRQFKTDWYWTGNDGGDTTVTGGSLNLFAGGGERGRSNYPSGIAGGEASGGDINTDGEGFTWYGNYGEGGDCPNGGSGAPIPPNTHYQGVDGGIPGGGGGGAVTVGSDGTSWLKGKGGGGGAYCQITLSRGEIAPGTSLSITVGAGGAGGVGNGYVGGDGARGQVDISWS